MKDSVKKNKTVLILAVLLVITGVFAMLQYLRAQKLAYYQDTEYNRIFYELTQYVDDLEISLLKGQVVSTPEQMAKLSADLYGQASAAKANLALLPVKGRTLAKTSEFLSQVGEYSICLSDKMTRGEEITKEETETMQDLLKYAQVLKGGLDEMLVDLNEGIISFSDEKGISGAFLKNKVSAADGLAGLEEEFHDYPSLIYDGPFSQHLSLKESVFLKGKAEISKKQAENLARKLIGRESGVTVTEIDGKIPSYSVKNNSQVVELTKNGGVLLLLMRDRAIDEEKLSLEDAKAKGMEFLLQNGFMKMEESYYEKQDGSAVINYAYKQDEYIVFPDLVKVKVALDNGEIIGFESRGYVTNHIFRDIPEPKITKEQALSNVNDNIETEEVSLAVIPLEDGSEAACWQIKGIVSEKHFLMYVNTQTGYIEDMKILLENENGTLAV